MLTLILMLKNNISLIFASIFGASALPERAACFFCNHANTTKEPISTTAMASWQKIHPKAYLKNYLQSHRKSQPKQLTKISPSL
jgi:hypothetical protein